MEIHVLVPGRGQITGKLFKHLSPVTITKILRILPLDGRVNLYEREFLYILTSLVAGEEKARKEFKKGDIAFMPAGCMICFFMQDIRSYKPMNPLGVVTSGMEVLDSCRRGDSLHIEVAARSGS